MGKSAKCGFYFFMLVFCVNTKGQMMHIPDGVLGPQTWLAGYGVMIPAWAFALKHVKQTLNAKYMPALAIGSAFSFVIMMFNIPIPGGSTGHAIGSALLSIIFGPWEAFLAVSIALVIQAVLFGDGGITAYGINCLNMAFIPCFISYGIYKILSGKNVSSKRNIFAAGVAGYISILAAALLTGFILGLQPILNHDAMGRPLYFAYPIKVAVPAMFLEHLFVFGWVEAMVTALVFFHLQKDKSFWQIVQHRHNSEVKEVENK